MNNMRVRITETGGREATARHVPPKLALAVGMPSTPTPIGWRWAPLTSLARLESGHTPSRRHPEYWGGEIPWIGITDARSSHGQIIGDTTEKTNELGIANSSARILPKNTVCLSRTASVGYVVIMGKPMATSQDFVNWVCGPQLEPNFLKYLLIAEGRDLLRFASGSVHYTIYFPEVKAFHICFPTIQEQQRIVGILDEAFDGIATAKANTEKNLQNARILFDDYLAIVVDAELKRNEVVPLSELAAEITDGDHMPPPKSLHGVPFITISNIDKESQQIDFSNTFTVSEQYFRKLKENRKPRSGDLLYTVAGSFGIPVVIDFDKAFCFQRHIGLIRPRTGTNSKWLWYLLKSRQVLKQAESGATGAAQRTVSLKVLRGFALPRVPYDRQLALSTKLDTLRSETQRLASVSRQKLAELEALKSSLLYHAFTGAL